jgi:hypothetical protein
MREVWAARWFAPENEIVVYVRIAVVVICLFKGRATFETTNPS